MSLSLASATAPQPQTHPVPQSTSITTREEPSHTTPTLQLRYRLSPPTYKHLLTIPSSPTRRQILETASQAHEFRSFPIRRNERAFFRAINDTQPIPYLLREAAVGQQPWHKVFLLVQVDLLKTGWPNKLSGQARKELQSERGKIYGVLNQVLRCVVDILGERLDGKGVSVGLDVLRSVQAGVWEGNGTELMQVDGVSLARMEKLVQAGVRNIRQLSSMEFYHIERILSRNPPFGQNILRQVKDFPYLQLKLDIISHREGMKEGTGLQTNNHWTTRVLLQYDNDDVPQWNKARPWVTLVIEGQDGRLAWFWRGSVKSLQNGGKEIVFRMGATKGEEMKVTFACEGIVGALCRGTFKV